MLNTDHNVLDIIIYKYNVLDIITILILEVKYKELDNKIEDPWIFT